MDRFTKLFLLTGGLLVWTYMLAPDYQTSLVAIKSGVDRKEIEQLWIVALIGVAIFLYAMYKEGITP